MQYIELKKLINNEIRQIKERIEKQVKKVLGRKEFGQRAHSHLAT